MDSDPRLSFSVSATTRKIRTGEVHGVHYYYMTSDEFRRRIAAGEFTEWEEVYPGRFYGTLKSELNRISAVGKVPLFDVDVVGGINLRKKFGDNALSIFIQPPSLEILRLRLEARGTDSAEDIRLRLAKAEKEMKFSPEFDKTIVNDVLEKAVQEAKSIVAAFIENNLR